MLTNPEQFAAKGDEWGVVPDRKPHRNAWRRKVHPDGFVEYTFRKEPDPRPGRLDWTPPVVAPQKHAPERASRDVNPFHALILARKAKRDAEVVARRNRVPFVPKRPENFQAPDEDALRAKRMADTRRNMLVARGKMGLFMTLDHWCEIFALFGGYAQFQAQVDRV